MRSRAFSLLLVMSPLVCQAGFDEGMSAYKSGDYAGALREFRSLAVLGDARAQNALGVMSEYGEGQPQDYKQALAWFQASADQGYAESMLNMSYMYEQGKGVEKNTQAAGAWACAAMSLGHLRLNDATHGEQLGHVNCLSGGHDQQQLAWLHTWAERHDPLAANELGVDYEHNSRLRDYAQALHWYRQAADQGVSMAQYRLGMMYKNGEAPQDYPQAILWIRLAARQGYAAALNELAGMYLDGAGVPRDIVLAHFFLTVSPLKLESLHGRQVHNAAMIVALDMSEDQLAEAHTLESQWVIGAPLPESSKLGAQ